MSELQPYVVYYLHYHDELLRNQAFSKYQDFSKCVLAKDSTEAIEKVQASMPFRHIKIMGISVGQPEWLEL